MHAHASERVERFHIVLLFNSDRVIDLAAAPCASRTHTHTRARGTDCCRGGNARARESIRRAGATERESIV